MAATCGSFSYALVSCESNGLMRELASITASSRYCRHATVLPPCPASPNALNASKKRMRAFSQSRCRIAIFPPASCTIPVIPGCGTAVRSRSDAAAYAAACSPGSFTASARCSRSACTSISCVPTACMSPPPPSNAFRVVVSTSSSAAQLPVARCSRACFIRVLNPSRSLPGPDNASRVAP